MVDYFIAYWVVLFCYPISFCFINYIRIGVYSGANLHTPYSGNLTTGVKNCYTGILPPFPVKVFGRFCSFGCKKQLWAGKIRNPLARSGKLRARQYIYSCYGR